MLGLLPNLAYSKQTFSHASYAAFRPSYPPALYRHVLDFHRGSHELCVDLGCGHGIVSRSLCSHFTKAIGVDPSSGMIEQAKVTVSNFGSSNVEFFQASAEDLDFIKDSSVDLITAGQASHWFDHGKTFKELSRVVRSGGSMAYWGYKDYVFVNFPGASKIMDDYAYSRHPDMLGSYWQQPGRSIVQNLLRDIIPPESDWEDVQRVEYEPGTAGKESGVGNVLMSKTCKVRECKEYIRTWSSYHGWSEAHPGQKARNKGGSGDIVDDLFERISQEEAQFPGEEETIDLEWGRVILLARRR